MKDIPMEVKLTYVEWQAVIENIQRGAIEFTMSTGYDAPGLRKLRRKIINQIIKDEAYPGFWLENDKGK